MIERLEFVHISRAARLEHGPNFLWPHKHEADMGVSFNKHVITYFARVIRIQFNIV